MVYLRAAFGGSFLFMRVAAPDLPATVVAFGRVAIEALLLGIAAGPRTFRSLVPSWRGFLVLGVFITAGPFLLFAYAERFITAGMGAIINATTPLWTVLVVAIWLRQRVTAMRVAATILLLPAALVSLPDAHLELDGTLAVIGIATVSTAIAWPVLFTINRTVGPVATSTITFLKPVFGILWGALVLAETVEPPRGRRARVHQPGTRTRGPAAR